MKALEKFFVKYMDKKLAHEMAKKLPGERLKSIPDPDPDAIKYLDFITELTDKGKKMRGTKSALSRSYNKWASLGQDRMTAEMRRKKKEVEKIIGPFIHEF